MGLGPHGTNGGRRVGLLSTLASDVGPAVPAAADGGFGAISLAMMPAPVPRTRPCWLCFSGELMNTWEWLHVGRAGLLGRFAAVWLFNPFDTLCLLFCPDMWIQASHVVPMSGFRHDAHFGVLHLAQCSTRSSLVVPLPVLPTSRLSFPICHRMVSLSSRAVRTERRGLEAHLGPTSRSCVLSRLGRGAPRKSRNGCQTLHPPFSGDRGGCWAGRWAPGHC